MSYCRARAVSAAASREASSAGRPASAPEPERPGQHVEADFRTSAAIHLADRILEFDPAGDDRGEIRFGRDAQLHVDVGEAKVTVNKKRAAAHLGEAGGEGGGSQVLPTPPLPEATAITDAGVTLRTGAPLLSGFRDREAHHRGSFEQFGFGGAPVYEQPCDPSSRSGASPPPTLDVKPS